MNLKRTFRKIIAFVLISVVFMSSVNWSGINYVMAENDNISNQEEEIQKIMSINGGSLPDMFLDEEDDIPSCINGKYSDVIVNDVESAVKSLHDITELMNIYWERVSFVEDAVYTNGNCVYYRLQQMYDNLKVQGKQLIITTDLEGNILNLNGDFDPIYEVDLTINYDEEYARAIAYKVFREDINDCELVLYSLKEGYDEAAWYITSQNGYIYVSASYGEVLDLINTTSFVQQPEETVVEEDGKYGSFNMAHDIIDEVFLLKIILEIIWSTLGLSI